MKYDSLLSELQRVVPGTKNILVALSTEPSVDDLAAGLALFLSLTAAGKNVSIVTEGIIRVGHTQLFGVGQIQNKLPQTGGGNLVISLGGVVNNGNVPSLEKLDWHPEGSDLNLVFHVIPGQKFEPTHITPHFEGSSFDQIFTVGATSLNSLGSLYQGNEDAFRNVPLANIDNKQGNSGFGTTNVIDPNASSVSEIVTQILTPLQLPFEEDTASNLLAGIFAATDNLQSASVKADTYVAVALAMQMGGQRPQSIPQPTPEAQNFGQAFSQPFQPISQLVQESVQPQPVQSQTMPSNPPSEQPSSEEQPMGEEVVTPESDWLTPKIYKGSSIG